MTERDRTPRVAHALDPLAAAGSRAKRAELRAAMLYESGYWCAEAVLKTVHDAAGEPLSPQVMRMASGFCEGFGGSRCTCGALAGAVMAAGLLCGREGPDDPWEPSYDVAAELRKRFVEDQNASTCGEIVSGIGGMHLPQRWAHCAELVGTCAGWVIEIAEREGMLDEEEPCLPESAGEPPAAAVG